MGRLIIFVAILVAGYFGFQFLNAQKTSGENAIANMETNESTPAALKIMKNIANEDIDEEFKRKTAQ